MKKVILYYSFALCVGIICVCLIFKPIFCAKSLIFPYAIHSFDICKEYPNTWKIIKKAYFITFIFTYNIILIKILKKFKIKNTKTGII